MKKILLGVIIILLVIMASTAIFKGISIGKFRILSTNEIAIENDNLTAEIQEVQKLMFTDYPAKTDELNNNISKMLSAKEEYLDLAKISTEGELARASQREIYTREFLYTKIGRYATSEGVLLEIREYAGTTGESNVINLNFTVTGQYYAIIDFISDLEDDSKLGFSIENFKMISASDDNVKATFTTSNVRIKYEQTTTQIETNNTNSQETTETTNTTE